MAQTYRKQKVVGNTGRRAFGSPSKKKYKKRPARAHHSNPDIIGFTMAAGNPGRRKGSMAKMRKKYNRKGKGGLHHHKGNPGHSKHVKKYRRNVGSGMGGLGPLVTNAAFVIIGALGTKLVTQAILGTKNTGVVGYAGNAAAGGILWFIAEKFMKNRAASVGVLSGTIVQILLRIINDFTPFGQYVAQLGMGDYQMQSFVTPQVLVDPWNKADIAIPPGWAPRMALPAAAQGGPAATMPAAAGGAGAGVSGLYGNGGGWGPGLYSA